MSQHDDLSQYYENCQYHVFLYREVGFIYNGPIKGAFEPLIDWKLAD